MQQNKASHAVSTWILLGIIMLLIQVLLGGITRLTGSGLSITEWNIITGTIPPTNNTQWQTEFEKYQATPQYNLLNTHFTLADFKYIFFWEWFHRFWARLIGIVFIGGFVYLLTKRYLEKKMQQPLLLLFLFGALQGAIGWIMVVSGLTGDEVYVKPTRLALHFVFAIGLIVFAYWFLLQLMVQVADRKNFRSLKSFCTSIIVLLFLQLVWGALMAGNKAASAAPTWPDINGEWLPTAGWMKASGWKNLLENKITIHFIHRAFGYLLFLLISLFTLRLSRVRPSGKYLSRSWFLPLFLAVLQVILGIVATVSSPGIVPNNWGLFETLAILHQLVAILLLLSLVTIGFLLGGKSYPSRS